MSGLILPGTAQAADVLAGDTFSAAAGLGLAGTLALVPGNPSLGYLGGFGIGPFTWTQSYEVGQGIVVLVGCLTSNAGSYVSLSEPFSTVFAGYQLGDASNYSYLWAYNWYPTSGTSASITLSTGGNVNINVASWNVGSAL